MRRPPREVRGRQLHCRRDRDRQGAPFTNIAMPSRARGELRHLVEPPAMRRPPREVRGRQLHCRRDRDRQGPRSPLWQGARAREVSSATWSSRRRCGDRRARYGVDNFTAAAIATGTGPRSPLLQGGSRARGELSHLVEPRRSGDRRGRHGVDNFTAAAIATGKGLVHHYCYAGSRARGELRHLVEPRRCGDRRGRYGVDNFTAAAIATGKWAQASSLSVDLAQRRHGPPTTWRHEKGPTWVCCR